jgi:hypothetical protein
LEKGGGGESITKKAFRVVWSVQLFLTKVASFFRTVQFRLSVDGTVKHDPGPKDWIANLHRLETITMMLARKQGS